MGNQKIPFKYFIPGIAWFFIVAFLTLMPGDDIPKIGWLSGFKNFDKIVHAGLFGGLTFFFSLPFFKIDFSYREKVNHFIKIALASIVWGITVEFLQKYFVIGRDFDLMDWAADSVGVLITLAGCIFVLKKMTFSVNN